MVYKTITKQNVNDVCLLGVSMIAYVIREETKAEDLKLLV